MNDRISRFNADADGQLTDVKRMVDAQPDRKGQLIAGEAFQFTNMFGLMPISHSGVGA